MNSVPSWTVQGELVQLHGRLDIEAAERLWPELDRWAPSSVPTTIDVADVDYCDGAGAAWLMRLAERIEALSGRAPQWSGRTQAIDAQLAPYERLAGDAAPPSGRSASLREAWRRSVAGLGEQLLAMVSFLGAIVAAVLRVARHPREMRWGDFLGAAEQAGFRALPIVSLIAFLLGVILAFQSAIAMRQFGAEIFVADLVSLSLLRELGPLMMAVLLAGRTGAAFAAEIGTMRVNEEVNALETMALDPVRFLVLPRILAALTVAPLLALYANVVGLIGAAVVMQGFGIPMVAFFGQVTGAVGPADLYTGLLKAGVFGFLVGLIGTWCGLATRSGAAAVGESTTRAVVLSIIAIVVVDGAFAVLFFFLGW